MATTYTSPTKGLDPTPEVEGERRMSNGAVRTVAYVDGRKTVTWDFTNDRHAE